MNIFLESSSIEEIRLASASGLVQGVIFSHADLDSEDSDGARSRLEEISQEFAIPICVSVGALNSADIYRDARELAKISDHIVVQLPLVEEALAPMHRLSAEGVDICATLIYTGAQALIAAKAGASMVRVDLDDLEELGQRSSDAIAEIRTVLEASGMEADVMAASPRTPAHFSDCVTAGANIICIPPGTIRALMVHPLTDRGIDRLLSDLSKRPKNRGS